MESRMGEGEAMAGGNRRRVQMRKERKDGFTAAKRQMFLDRLGACCNVTRAAAAAGVSTVTVNYHRRRDPGFARQCEEALALGYETLEAAMLEAAAHGPGYVPGADGDGAPGPETMDRELALQLLRLRGKPMGERTGRAGRAPGRVSETALNESILAKLEILDRRLKGGRVPARSEVRKMKASEASGDVSG
jgi:hypothetical protein